MALSWVVSVLFLVLVLASFESSTCSHVVKGSVSCLDCKFKDDLADVKVLVKCEKVKQFTTTDKDGSFEAQLTTDPSTTPCKAQLLGGPQQLCSYRKSMVSKIVKDHSTNSYTISTPLAFSTSCPSKAKAGKSNSMYGSSKTVDLPLPSEWGLPPTSYYIPIFPIGIP